MSLKSKNLQFEANEPSFLRRLRGQARGGIDDEGRHINPVALPKRPRRLENDEDDAPTYVVEGSHETLSKDEYEAMKVGDDPDNKDAGEEAGEGDKPTSISRTAVQRVAEAGVSMKKRKATRIGDDGDNAKEGDAALATKPQSSARQTKKSKKKAKTIKLSFGDDDDK
jgi:hypothetical protein